MAPPVWPGTGLTRTARDSWVRGQSMGRMALLAAVDLLGAAAVLEVAVRTAETFLAGAPPLAVETFFLAAVALLAGALRGSKR